MLNSALRRTAPRIRRLRRCQACPFGQDREHRIRCLRGSPNERMLAEACKSGMVCPQAQRRVNAGLATAVAAPAWATEPAAMAVNASAGGNQFLAATWRVHKSRPCAFAVPVIGHRADLCRMPGLSSTLAARTDSITSIPGTGESETRAIRPVHVPSVLEQRAGRDVFWFEHKRSADTETSVAAPKARTARRSSRGHIP